MIPRHSQDQGRMFKINDFKQAKKWLSRSPWIKQWYQGTLRTKGEYLRWKKVQLRFGKIANPISASPRRPLLPGSASTAKLGFPLWVAGFASHLCNPAQLELKFWCRRAIDKDLEQIVVDVHHARDGPIKKRTMLHDVIPVCTNLLGISCCLRYVFCWQKKCRSRDGLHLAASYVSYLI